VVALVKISEVKIPNRIRSGSADIQTLRESIKRIGLLQPIGITKDRVLVYGFRRLEAAKSLGWEEIPYVLVELDKFNQKVAELEENLKRKDLTWQEEAKAKAEIHKLYQELYGLPKAGHRSDLKGPLSESERGWGLKKTAELLNESIGLTSQDIKLAEALEEYPQLRREANKSKALRILERIRRPEKPAEKHWECDLCGTIFSEREEKLKLSLCPLCYTKIEEHILIPKYALKKKWKDSMSLQEWLGIENDHPKNEKDVLLAK
jgi:ParB family chromosome partitioning protein